MRIRDWSSDVCSSDLGAPPIACPLDNIRSACPDGVPVIPTKPGALGELLNNAPLLLERLTTLTERLTDLLSDRNQASIAGILDNVEDLTTAFAERGPEIAAKWDIGRAPGREKEVKNGWNTGAGGPFK